MSAATTTERSLLTALLAELAAGAPVAVGVDLTHIPSVGERLARLGPRWLGDQFTVRELRELDGVRNGGHATLAGRLAAKEAFIKLLTPQDDFVLHRDIEILRASGGAPVVHAHRSALAAAGRRALTSWSVSITHQGDWAAAVAVGAPALPAPGPVHTHHTQEKRS
ncbi:4'-phosphopantetheinyl transferase superfamily protein [Streptomyces sp. NBC_00656]|uniref:holo-ACP synthase n=1 Tax=Streptomyces sp. NBC_00656 TaxID=2903668 RepID=UPI003253AB85